MPRLRHGLTHLALAPSQEVARAEPANIPFVELIERKDEFMTFLNILILSAGAIFGFSQWQKMKKKTPDDHRPKPEQKFKGGGEPTKARP